jgi:hypothetical protein
MRGNRIGGECSTRGIDEKCARNPMGKVYLVSIGDDNIKYHCIFTVKNTVSYKVYLCKSSAYPPIQEFEGKKEANFNANMFSIKNP